jgi:hypothetical protein
MTNFLLVVLIGLVAFCSLSLYLLVVQLATVREIIEDWVISDDDDEDDDGRNFSYTPDPFPPDDHTLDLSQLRSSLIKQYQKS